MNSRARLVLSAVGVACLLGAWLFWLQSAVAEELPEVPEVIVWTDPETGIQEVFLEGQGTRQAEAVLFGRGIAEIGDTGSASTSEGGMVEWWKIQDRLDQRGNRHVVYHQHYHPRELPQETEALLYGTDGVWLNGGVMGLHFGPNGDLRWVSGTQHLGVVATSNLLLTTPGDAFVAAHAGAAAWPDINLGDYEQWPDGLQEHFVEQTTLSLSCQGPGVFAFIWKVPTRDVRQVPVVVTVDAKTATVLNVVSGLPSSQCGPDSQQVQMAVGYPENSQFGPEDRGGAVRASPGSAYGEFSHEAHWYSDAGFLPSIQVFFWQGR